MRRHSVLLLSLLTFAFGGSCKDKDKVRFFYKQTDVVNDELKGKVRSVVKYHCSLDSSRKYCSVQRKEYNERGFLTERTDSSKSDIYSNKYFYNGDGLLIKKVSTSNLFGSLEETYVYSFSERKKTEVFHQDNSVDTIVTLYDRTGNEIQHSSKTDKYLYEYDKHGFLILEKSTSLTDPQDYHETRYINDAQGRPVKATQSDGTLQLLVYNKNGNLIQQTTFIRSEKIADWYTGYCEFDKNGNYLKKISMSPFIKEVNVDSLVIEYY